MPDSIVELPLFPLRTILFPGGVLPLRIFEPRYIDMIGACMKQETGFGICAVLDEEVENSTSEIYSVGTEVRIIDFESLPENLLGITVQGQKRFTITSNRIEPNQLRIAQINYFAAEEKAAIPKQYKRLSELLRRMFPDVEKYYGKAHMQSIQHDFDDAGWVGARLAEYLPFELKVKQILLECEDPIERLRILYETLRHNQ